MTDEERSPEPHVIPALLRARADATPDAPALLAPGKQPLSYRQLDEQTGAVAAQLRSVGIGKDDRVALVHPNGPEAAAAFLAISSAAVCAPLNPTYRQSEYDYYLSDLRAKAVVVETGTDSPLRQLAKRRDLRVLEIVPSGSGEAGRFELSHGRPARRHDPGPDDTALVLHTSGTTARPKIVPLTHRRLLLSAANVARTLELRPDDRCLNVMPLFHIHGLVAALLGSLSAGASVVCTGGFHAPSFHTWLADVEPTWYTAVPTMHQAVVARVEREAVAPGHSSLRLVRSSSAPLPPQVYDDLEAAFGVPVIEAYGMTEAAHEIASNPLPPALRKRGSVGTTREVELAIVAPDGEPVARGEVGDVVIRGETVFTAYEANPEANEDAFVAGWFRTGDVGRVDDDGYVFLQGRRKEIINRGGEKIAPAEVEEALLGHPDVVQAVSFAVPHGSLGEEVGAAVILRDGSQATERELQERVATRLADFKVPSIVAVVDDIPRGPTGKLQRIGLAEQLGIGATSRPEARATYLAPRTAFEHELAELWAATLDVDEVGVDDDFFSLGGDSILGAELLARVAERTGRVVPLTTLMWAPTLGAFASVLEQGGWDEDSLIVPVQATGSRAPLFVAHGLGDEVLNVAVLKRSLGDEQPTYALRARIDRLDFDSVEEMAASYFEEIRAVQPSGPYRFAGICSGVAIVFELARCALTRGEEVALAAVIDPLPVFGRRGPRRYAERAVHHGRNRMLLWAVRRELRVWASRAGLVSHPETLAPGHAFWLATGKLRRRYRLRRLSVTFTVISTMDYVTPRSFWEGLTDGVDWYDVPAPHVTIFQQPHADVLGATFAEVLRRADDGETAA